MKLIAIVFALLLTGCSDTVKSDYPNYQSAIDNKLFIRGWLPKVLPTTTVNIHVSNDLDLNMSEGYFDIPVNDLAKFISSLTKETNGEFNYLENSKKWVFTINDQTGRVTYRLVQTYS
jgi:PBP1b-binding outer membrane lipoprotein LpoB